MVQHQFQLAISPATGVSGCICDSSITTIKVVCALVISFSFAALVLKSGGIGSSSSVIRKIRLVAVLGALDVYHEIIIQCYVSGRTRLASPSCS
jgi:hypothetical protein